jgi:hypothetical protein
LPRRVEGAFERCQCLLWPSTSTQARGSVPPATQPRRCAWPTPSRAPVALGHELRER